MSQEKPAQEEPAGPVIIEEKITKKNGEVVVKKFLKGKILGKGGFATCYEITDLEKNKLQAAKIVSKASLTKKRALEKLLAEIKIHKSLHHENIVQFEHVFEDKENVYILLELCQNQTLKELLKKQKRLTDAECATFIVQTINALKSFIESKQTLNIDPNTTSISLKLGNLLLGKMGEIKVADFGLAAKIEQDGERRRTICGTPNYIAPEVLDKKQGHSFEVDIWSLGVICYTLLAGRPPFETNDTKATYRKILKLNYAFPTNVPFSDNAKDLIKKILVLEPTKRPTLDDILEHSFIKSNYKPPLIHPDTAGSFKKGLTLQGTSSPQGIFASSSDKAMLQTLTPSHGYPKDASRDREIDENDIYGQSALKRREKFGIGHYKIKSYEAKHEDLISGVSPRTFANFDKITKPDYETYVSKWVDYSSKYGLGYLLSDGTAGIVFKDLTRITLSPDGSKFEYTKRQPEQNKEILMTFTLAEPPKELEKRILLLNYFKNYLEGTDKNGQEEKPTGNEKGRVHEAFKSMPLIYVKKWTKTNNAFIFRLSNRIVQIDFVDKTQIIVSPGSQIICYKNKKGESSQHPLVTAADSDNPELVKRLKYAKEILNYFKHGSLIKLQEPVSSTGNGRIDIDSVEPRLESVPTPEIFKEGLIEKLPPSTIAGLASEF